MLPGILGIDAECAPMCDEDRDPGKSSIGTLADMTAGAERSAWSAMGKRVYTTMSVDEVDANTS